jgi:hypothetical protein
MQFSLARRDFLSRSAAANAALFGAPVLSAAHFRGRLRKAMENVWNNLWVQPAPFQNFVASFRNPWVKAYFDIGNHVKYAPPQTRRASGPGGGWLRRLGHNRRRGSAFGRIPAPIRFN